MIKVSVIVPVYNGEAHLAECLDSIKNQTLNDIEIICVDDGSTDSSYEILERYQAEDDRFQIYRQENKYAGAARNLGKSHATGEYLAFWDCDDFFDLEALEKLYNRAKETDADVCVCGGNQFLESKQKLYPWPPYLSRKKVDGCDTFNRFTHPDCYLNFTNAAAWNKIYRRKYIEGLGLDFQCVRNGNDVYFTVSAIGLADRIAIVDEKLINYRVNQNSGLVCSLSKSPLSPIKAWIDIAENLEKHDGFGEQSFANKAIGSMIYMLQNIQEWNAFHQAVTALKDYGLEKMHILPREDGYYYNKWNGECVKHLYHDKPEEFAVFFSYSMYIQKAEAFAEKRGMSQEISTLKKTNKELVKKEKNIARDLKKKTNECNETRQKLELINGELEATKRELEKTRKEVEKTKKSWSFRVGRAIVWLPGKIKRFFEHK
jgi:glycosyltransferase involved in cell wall biosynthesis